MQPEYLAETIIQIDIGELHMRSRGNTAVGAGETERSSGDPAEGLRFADGDIEFAVAHRGGDRGAAQSSGGYFDVSGREPQIETEIVEALERDRQLTPVAFVAREQPNSGNIGRQIERVGCQRALH